MKEEDGVRLYVLELLMHCHSMEIDLPYHDNILQKKFYAKTQCFDFSKPETIS
jgi:hypothetical protein